MIKRVSSTDWIYPTPPFPTYANIPLDVGEQQRMRFAAIHSIIQKWIVKIGGLFYDADTLDDKLLLQLPCQNFLGMHMQYPDKGYPAHPALLFLPLIGQNLGLDRYLLPLVMKYMYSPYFSRVRKGWYYPDGSYRTADKALDTHRVNMIRAELINQPEPLLSRVIYHPDSPPSPQYIAQRVERLKPIMNIAKHPKDTSVFLSQLRNIPSRHPQLPNMSQEILSLPWIPPTRHTRDYERIFNVPGYRKAVTKMKIPDTEQDIVLPPTVPASIVPANESLVDLPKNVPLPSQAAAEQASMLDPNSYLLWMLNGELPARITKTPRANPKIATKGKYDAPKVPSVTNFQRAKHAITTGRTPSEQRVSVTKLQSAQLPTKLRILSAPTAARASKHILTLDKTRKIDTIKAQRGRLGFYAQPVFVDAPMPTDATVGYLQAPEHYILQHDFAQEPSRATKRVVRDESEDDLPAVVIPKKKQVVSSEDNTRSSRVNASAMNMFNFGLDTVGEPETSSASSSTISLPEPEIDERAPVIRKRKQLKDAVVNLYQIAKTTPTLFNFNMAQEALFADSISSPKRKLKVRISPLPDEVLPAILMQIDNMPASNVNRAWNAMVSTSKTATPLELWLNIRKHIPKITTKAQALSGFGNKSF